VKLWDLPEGWEWRAFDEVANVDSNLVDPADYSELPHIAPNHIESGTGRLLPFQTIAKDGVTSAKHLFKPGHILYSKIRPYLAKAVMVDFEGLCSADMYPVSTSLDPQFLHRWLISSTFTAQASLSQGRTVLPKINKKALGVLKVPVPPLPTQRRIVARIESLQARSRRAKESLDAIPPLLERFRQSVLAAAFRGDLTADWRSKNPDVEPSSVLLERIRAERKRRWIDAEAQKAHSKAEAKARKAGKPWTEADESKALEAGRKRAEKKYKEPEPVDPEGLPELPDGWCWARWGELSSWVTYGFTRPMPHVDEGPRILTAKNVLDGRLDLTRTHRTTTEAYLALSEKDRPQPGDLLITKDGSIGRPCVVPAGLGPFCINQSVAVVWLRGCPVNRDYLQLTAASPATQRAIALRAKGNAIQHLKITDFARLPLALAPSAEQEAVVLAVSGRLASARRLSKLQATGSSGLTRLDKSVLASAFRGEL